MLGGDPGATFARKGRNTFFYETLKTVFGGGAVFWRCLDGRRPPENRGARTGAHAGAVANPDADADATAGAAAGAAPGGAGDRPEGARGAGPGDSDPAEDDRGEPG